MILRRSKQSRFHRTVHISGGDGTAFQLHSVNPYLAVAGRRSHVHAENQRHVERHLDRQDDSPPFSADLCSGFRQSDPAVPAPFYIFGHTGFRRPHRNILSLPVSLYITAENIIPRFHRHRKNTDVSRLGNSPPVAAPILAPAAQAQAVFPEFRNSAVNHRSSFLPFFRSSGKPRVSNPAGIVGALLE